MKPNNRRLRAVLTFTLAILLPACGSSGFAQQQPAPAKQNAAASAEVKPKIRTITAFINLDRSQYQLQFAETAKFLGYAKTVFESCSVRLPSFSSSR